MKMHNRWCLSECGLVFGWVGVVSCSSVGFFFNQRHERCLVSQKSYNLDDNKDIKVWWTNEFK